MTGLTCLFLGKASRAFGGGDAVGESPPKLLCKIYASYPPSLRIQIQTVDTELVTDYFNKRFSVGSELLRRTAKKIISSNLFRRNYGKC